MKKIWEQLDLTCKEWRRLAEAFYSLAHNDFDAFTALPEKLQNHPAGILCSQYMESRDYDLIEKAGRILTHSNCWGVYLGRIM